MFGFLTLRNEPKAFTLVRCVILGILSVFLLVSGGINYARVHKKPIDLNETHMDWNQLENGQHVQMDVEVLIGEYMYQTYNGEETSRDYLMPHIIYDSHNNYYTMDRAIGVKINREYFDTADTIVDNSVAWLRDRSGNTPPNTVTIHIDGYLQKMNDDQLKYCKEAMTAAGYTAHDLAATIVPYYICDNANSGFVLLICGIISAIGTAGLTIYALKKK